MTASDDHESMDNNLYEIQNSTFLQIEQHDYNGIEEKKKEEKEKKRKKSEGWRRGGGDLDWFLCNILSELKNQSSNHFRYKQKTSYVRMQTITDMFILCAWHLSYFCFFF